MHRGMPSGTLGVASATQPRRSAPHTVASLPGCTMLTHGAPLVGQQRRDTTMKKLQAARAAMVAMAALGIIAVHRRLRGRP